MRITKTEALSLYCVRWEIWGTRWYFFSTQKNFEIFSKNFRASFWFVEIKLHIWAILTTESYTVVYFRSELIIWNCKIFVKNQFFRRSTSSDKYFSKKNIFDLSCIFNSFLGRKVPINEFLFIPGEHWFLFLLTLMICVDRLINTEWLGCPRLFPGAKLYTPRKNYSSQKF